MNRVLLTIFDGFGLAPTWGGNAISAAKLTNFTKIWNNYPHSVLDASGTAVGLSGHEMGNSEVGHLNIGSGTVPILDGTLISNQINNGEFNQNKILLDIFERAAARDQEIHFIGLASDGGIHSHINHLFALIALSHQYPNVKIWIHPILDGRDSDPHSGIEFIEKLTRTISSNPNIEIATFGGRYFAMDRDNHWDRTDAAIIAIMMGKGKKSSNILSDISTQYRIGITDEYIPYFVCKKYEGINENDYVIIVNFRSDRMRQLQSRLVQLNPNVNYATFAPYGLTHDVENIVHTIFKPDPIKTSLSIEVSKYGTQYHIAETEKYAHVTYFFNGGKEAEIDGEERMLVPSQRVGSHDEAPQMQAKLITENLIDRIKNKKDILLVANYANADIVGHTGNMESTIIALNTLDSCLLDLANACEKYGVFLILTADHGNAEQMINPINGEIDTKHTSNPVPFCLITKNKFSLEERGKLCDVAPTILALLGIPQTQLMTGHNLIVKE